MPAPAAGETFAFRANVESFEYPAAYVEHGVVAEADSFWNRADWDAAFRKKVNEGYNAVVYFCNPWLERQWQTFLIRHDEFPEAREIPPDRLERLIEQVNWVFHRARELGLRNFMYNHTVITTRAFAHAHGMEEPTPTQRARGLTENWGVRNEWTRAFTEAAVAELFRVYPDLDGLYGGMSEQLPGQRSTWYREAIVPGLARSGRRPIFIVDNWMMPVEDFLADIAPREVYDNTWLAVETQGETLTDVVPWPESRRWIDGAAALGVPVVIKMVPANLYGDWFPCDSPRLASQLVREYARLDGCVGFIWHVVGRSDPNRLMHEALGYYGARDEPYADEPWLNRLEERFGDRAAAEHFLKALDASARITPEVGALAWYPHDSNCHFRLTLRYWHWQDDNPLGNSRVSPGRGAGLIPVRHYAEVVARLGEGYRDNNGSDLARHPRHPGWQELFWSYTDYPTTPEEHMRRVKALGETARREADAALTTVSKNVADAQVLADYMTAYQLLTDYYERKVLAAISALIYKFGGQPDERARAERLADEAVALYQTAIEFVWKTIDHESGNIKSKWGNEFIPLPELIEAEKRERSRLPTLFGWS